MATLLFRVRVLGTKGQGARVHAGMQQAHCARNCARTARAPRFPSARTHAGTPCYGVRSGAQLPSGHVTRCTSPSLPPTPGALHMAPGQALPPFSAASHGRCRAAPDVS